MLADRFHEGFVGVLLSLVSVVLGSHSDFYAMRPLQISHTGNLMFLSHTGNYEKVAVPRGVVRRERPALEPPDGGLPWNQKAMRNHNSTKQKRTAIDRTTAFEVAQ